MCEQNYFRYGSKPMTIDWRIVRGDTSTLKVEFLENDEATFWDNSGWQYVATAYDKFGDALDELTITVDEGFILVTAPSDVTANWGNTFGEIVAELRFDVEVTIPTEDIVWTPIVGTITVLGDVSYGGSL